MKPFRTLLFYKYVQVDDAEEFAARLLEFCREISIKGRLIVAPEGLNGTVSGTPEQCQRLVDFLEADPRFGGIDYKTDEVDEPSFQKIFVRFKPEIVHSGLRDPEQINPMKETGIHLKGADFLQLKDQEDVVILDVRSNYEHQLGKFKNAITLDMENFREFPGKLAELEHLKDKKVITYCTGGIKCEKASALLLQQGFKQVFQLEGGIIKYAAETGGRDFEGQCYVFDNRIAVAVNTVNPVTISRCRICGTPTARMVNCANPECNDHFVLCEPCGDQLHGCCSAACAAHPRRRTYDGTGYYQKGEQSFVNPAAAHKRAFNRRRQEEA